MKIYYKIFLIILCISLFPLSAVHAESITDNIYKVYIRTPSRIWIDQFEFDAGDVFNAYTQKESTLSGTWIETELIETDLIGNNTFFSLNWFQAFVEKEEEPTTTTTTPETTTTITPPGFGAFSQRLVKPQRVKYEIFLQGTTYTWTIALDPDGIPDTGDEKEFGFSFMIGSGAYLGADSTLFGFAGVSGTGGGGGGGIGDAAFGSISPDNGKQESTEVDVEITCDNTTFLDDGVNDIIFIPDNGLTVENIRVDNDTTIKFNLKIAVDAPEGDKIVVVSWNDPPETLSSDSVSKFFTVTPKSD